MTILTRADADRRATERRHTLGQGFSGRDKRADERRGYLDRRRDPKWRESWLRSRVTAALRD